MYAASTLVSLAALAGLVVGHKPAPPHGNATSIYPTKKTVSSIFTYCPTSTVITWAKKPITVTKPTMLTVTDCPCTIVEPCHTCAPMATPTPMGPHPVPNPKQPPSQVPQGQGPQNPQGPQNQGQGPQNQGQGYNEGQVPEVAGAKARHVAYGLDMAAAGAVGYFALL